MSRVHIIDYGMGNLRSVAGAVRYLGHDPVICSNPVELAAAQRVILPGVGAFGQAMSNLNQRRMIEPLTDLAVHKQRPFLGICLGGQLLCRDSDEFGMNQGLGWLNARVRSLSPDAPGLRIPHVGWDELDRKNPSPLFEDVPEHSLFYYVHSFKMIADEEDLVAAECSYGCRFAAILIQDSMVAVQFHPEKSQQAGLILLRNFIERF
ncbi:MAG: imidazole glycerol phosphate synthase subunit HisH [Rhodospirillales bacterium]|nr:MAG: imidazole glycerol phosphate synthase subunit HisH [Rhodospirillales bacterium]